jgi:hypothetical protein
MNYVGGHDCNFEHVSNWYHSMVRLQNVKVMTRLVYHLRHVFILIVVDDDYTVCFSLEKKNMQGNRWCTLFKRFLLEDPDNDPREVEWLFDYPKDVTREDIKTQYVQKKFMLSSSLRLSVHKRRFKYIHPHVLLFLENTARYTTFMYTVSELCRRVHGAAGMVFERVDDDDDDSQCMTMYRIDHEFIKQNEELVASNIFHRGFGSSQVDKRLRIHDSSYMITHSHEMSIEQDILEYIKYIKTFMTRRQKRQLNAVHRVFWSSLIQPGMDYVDDEGMVEFSDLISSTLTELESDMYDEMDPSSSTCQLVDAAISSLEFSKPIERPSYPYLVKFPYREYTLLNKEFHLKKSQTISLMDTKFPVYASLGGKRTWMLQIHKCIRMQGGYYHNICQGVRDWAPNFLRTPGRQRKIRDWQIFSVVKDLMECYIQTFKQCPTPSSILEQVVQDNQGTVVIAHVDAIMGKPGIPDSVRSRYHFLLYGLTVNTTSETDPEVSAAYTDYNRVILGLCQDYARKFV